MGARERILILRLIKKLQGQPQDEKPLVIVVNPHARRNEVDGCCSRRQ